MDENNKVLSFGEWIITLILTAIPLVNIVVLLYWAFGANVNLNKKNFSRATLVIAAVGVVIAIIFNVIFAALLFSSFQSNMSNSIMGM